MKSLLTVAVFLIPCFVFADGKSDCIEAKLAALNKSTELAKVALELEKKHHDLEKEIKDVEAILARVTLTPELKKAVVASVDSAKKMHKAGCDCGGKQECVYADTKFAVACQACGQGKYDVGKPLFVEATKHYTDSLKHAVAHMLSFDNAAKALSGAKKMLEGLAKLEKQTRKPKVIEKLAPKQKLPKKKQFLVMTKRKRELIVSHK